MSKDKFEPTDDLVVLALATNAANQAGEEICNSGVALNGDNPGAVKVSGQMCANCVYGVKRCPRPKAEAKAFEAVEVAATQALNRAQSNGRGR